MLALRQSHPEGPIEQVAAPEGKAGEDQEACQRGGPDDRVNRSGDEFEILGADLAARLEEEQALSPEFVVDSRIVVVAGGVTDAAVDHEHREVTRNTAQHLEDESDAHQPDYPAVFLAPAHSPNQDRVDRHEHGRDEHRSPDVVGLVLERPRQHADIQANRGNAQDDQPPLGCRHEGHYASWFCPTARRAFLLGPRDWLAAASGAGSVIWAIKSGSAACAEAV